MARVSVALQIASIASNGMIAASEPPEETFSEDGLLQPFWSDAIHANPAYSALLVDRLVGVAASHVGES